MSGNLSIIKKYSMYREYKRSLSKLTVELENRYRMRVDDAMRMYTVLNIPEEIIGEAYSLKKSDIDRISDNYIREYCQDLGGFLNAGGLTELYDFYELKKVDKYSYLIIVGFSMFRTDTTRERLLKYWMPIGVGVVLVSVLLMLLL